MSITKMRLPGIFASVFRIDPRSLALFRVAVAMLLLVDLAIRFSDLRVMYTDDGMFPRAEMKRWFDPLWSWSFHSWGGSAAYETALFGVAALLAAALLAGFQTRIAVTGSWLMLISIQHRVQPIQSGAEILLRILLFWAMFLPLAHKWSVDAFRKRRRGGVGGTKENTAGSVASIATVAILVQMGLTWVFSAIFKTNTQWLHGEALALVLAHDFYASPAAAFLLQYPGLLKILTVAAYVVEWAALLLFVPNFPRLRVVIIVALAALHLGIGVCLEVGLFAYVSLAGLILFLPSEFWNSRLFTRRKASHPEEEGRGIDLTASYLPPGARLACGVFLAYVLAVNISGLPGKFLQPLRNLSLERRTLPLSKGLGLGQRWGMFEEAPSKDGWCVARATLADGSQVDLLRGGTPVDWERPDFPGHLYPNHYWQKLFREMNYTDDKGYQLFRPLVGRYLCRTWDAAHPPSQKVREFDLIFCYDRGTPATEPGNRELLLFLGPDKL